MRCKAGDKAFVVKGKACGTLVEVQTLQVNRNTPTWTVIFLCSGPAYRSNTKTWDKWPAGTKVSCPDDFLRPIRDTDGKDEMLRITGKPKVNEIKINTEIIIKNHIGELKEKP